MVVSIDVQSGRHEELLALPTDPYCTTQHDGDCRLAAARWGKAMLDSPHRRWILPMSSAQSWNLTLVHVDIDSREVTKEVPLRSVGYGQLYSSVTNTALDPHSNAVVALCAKRTGIYSASSWLVKIDANSGVISELSNHTGIAWTMGSGNLVYDATNAVLYYVLADVAQDQPERYVAALPAAEGSTMLGKQAVGSSLPPDLLLLV